jgi:hypothetical protein
LLKREILAAIILALGTAAHAETGAVTNAGSKAPSSGFYAGFGYGSLGIESGTLGDYTLGDLDFPAGLLLAGFEINKYLAVEAEGTVMTQDDTYSGIYRDYDVEASYNGVFIKAQMPLSDVFSAHLRLGRIERQLEIPSIAGTKSTSTSTGYGIGGEYRLTEKLGVRADYTWGELSDSNGSSDVKFMSLLAVFHF